MVSLPFGVKEVMYYAAAAQWVMLCEEPVCGPDRVSATLRRFEDSTGCLNPFVPDLFKLEWVLDSEVCPLAHSVGDLNSFTGKRTLRIQKRFLYNT